MHPRARRVAALLATHPWYLNLLLRLAALLVALYALLGVRRRMRVRVPPYRPATTADASPAVTAALARHVEEAKSLGFRPVAYVAGASPRMPVTAALAHPAAGDQLLVAVVLRPSGGLGAFINFYTKWDDGHELDTTNAERPRIFAYPPTKASFRFPQLGSPRPLYAAHRALLARHAPRRGPGRLPAPHAVIAELDASARADLQYQVARGQLTQRGDGTFVPTWRGSLWYTWRLFPGLSAWHAARQRRAAARLLRTLV